MKHGPFGYAEPATPSTTAPLQDDRRREDLLARVRKECDRARDDAPVRHFLDVYGDDHDHPPLWLAAELFSFGDLVTLYRDSWRSVRKEVADDFGVSEEVLGSWLLSLNFVRNVCAHHGRLWNREIRVRPQVPRNPIWRHQVLEATNRVFFTLTALAHLLGIISEGTSWARRFRDLLARYPDVPLRAMGLREGWEQHPVWAPRLATDP